jgi:hypothetical protein
MTPLKAKVSLRRLIRLFGYVGIAIVGIAFMLSIYNKMAWRHHLLDAETKSLSPTFTPGPEDFETSDLFYRSILHGEGELVPILYTHIKKPDVVTRGRPKVESRDASWSLFGGHLDGWWEQHIQWCVRIRFRAGRNSADSEWQFAQDLLNLAALDGAQSFNLPARIDHNLSPQEAHDITTRFGNGVLLAVESIRHGKSKRDIEGVNWRLAPDSDICKAASN